MAPGMMPSPGAVRLLAGVVPITVLAAVWSLILLISLFLPESRRQYVLDLAPHLENAIRAITGSPRQAKQKSKGKSITKS